jgi:hypothetical protein
LLTRRSHFNTTEQFWMLDIKKGCPFWWFDDNGFLRAGNWIVISAVESLAWLLFAKDGKTWWGREMILNCCRERSEKKPFHFFFLHLVKS